jgi:hypothetical protein
MGGRWKSLAYRSFDIEFNLQLRLSATAQLSLYSSRLLGRDHASPVPCDLSACKTYLFAYTSASVMFSDLS